MRSWDIEVMHMVRMMIAITEHSASRSYRELKHQASLVLIRSRMHPRLHDAFAHRALVSELREVPDKVVHATLALCGARGRGFQNGAMKSHSRCSRTRC